MKFSLTFIMIILILFVTSCSTVPTGEKSIIKLQLDLQTSNKYKEKIIESLLRNEIKFTINFSKENSYILDQNIFNSNLKYFCNSMMEDERKTLESNIFNNKRNENKKILVVYFKEYEDIVLELKKKYPNEEYHLIKMNDYDSQIKRILYVDLSIKNYSELSRLDNNIELLHSPRVRDDFTGIYFLSNYDSGKTVVPIFRSYALDIDYFSSTEIFHDASDIKKLVDFENTFIPITNKMIENISKKQIVSIKDEIENTLIKDLLTVEKIYQNNLFRKDIVPDSGNIKVKRNNCINRNLRLWKVSTNNLTG